MATTHDLAIETVGLVKRFPKQPGWRNLLRSGPEKLVLDGISLAVPRGEIFGLLGPNGAGKTTLTKILCTLITPTAGQARVAGLDVVRHDREVRQRIGLVYGDQRSFYWRLSLVENLRFYAALYRIPQDMAERRIADLIGTVGLEDAANVRMHYFSSGMKQRAAIARGLLADPDVLLLDEPTTSVDPIAAHQIRRLIRELVRQNDRRTVLLLTNLMDEAEALCDRIGLLNHGRIEIVGTVATLRERFESDERYVLSVSGVGEPALHAVAATYGVQEVRVRASEPDRWELEVAVRRQSAAIPAVIRQLVGASAQIWSCTRIELSLDEMFRLAFDQPVVSGERHLQAPPEVVGSVR